MPIYNPLFILAALCLFVMVSEWLVRRTALRHLGTALLVILITAIAANLRLIPAGSSPEMPVPVYDAIFAYVAPIAIFWLLLPVSLRDIMRAGLPIITLFVIGAGGVVLGAFIALHTFSGMRGIGPLHGPLGGMFVATYIGGSINFNAVALGYDVIRNGTLYAGAVAVDNVVTTTWMIATLALPRLLAPLWMRLPAGEEGDVGLADRVERAAVTDFSDADAERVDPGDLGLVLALGFLALIASDGISDLLQRAGVTVPSILVLTVIALVLAQIPAISRLRGVRVLGMFAVYLFLAVIGAFCDVPRLLGLGRTGLVLLGFAATLVLVHGVVTFVAARLLRIDAATAAVALQANVGGSTSALALARSLGRGDLVLPGVLVGALGNALGTFVGFWAAGRLM